MLDRTWDHLVAKLAGAKTCRGQTEGGTGRQAERSAWRDP